MADEKKIRINADQGINELKRIEDTVNAVTASIRTLNKYADDLNSTTDITAANLANMANEAKDLIDGIKADFKSLGGLDSEFEKFFGAFREGLKELAKSAENVDTLETGRQIASNILKGIQEGMSTGSGSLDILSGVLQRVRDSRGAVRKEMQNFYSQLSAAPGQIDVVRNLPFDEFQDAIPIIKQMADLEKDLALEAGTAASNMLSLAEATNSNKVIMGAVGKEAVAASLGFERIKDEVQEFGLTSSKIFAESLLKVLDFGETVDAVTLNRARQQLYGLAGQLDALGEKAGVTKEELIALVQQAVRGTEAGKKLDVRQFAGLTDANDIRLQTIAITERLLGIKSQEEEADRKAIELQNKQQAAEEAKTNELNRQARILENMRQLRSEIDKIDATPEQRRAANTEVAKIQNRFIDDKSLGDAGNIVDLYKDMLGTGESINGQNVRQAQLLTNVAKISSTITQEATNRLEAEQKNEYILRSLSGLASKLDFSQLESDEIEKFNGSLAQASTNLARIEGITEDMDLAAVFRKATENATDLNTVETKLVAAARTYLDQISRLEKASQKRITAKERELAVDKQIAKIISDRPEDISWDAKQVNQYYTALSRLRELMLKSDMTTDQLSQSWEQYNAQTLKVNNSNFKLVQSFNNLVAPISATNAELTATAINLETLLRFTEFRTIAQAFYGLYGQIQQSAQAALEFGKGIAQIQTISKNIPLSYDAWSASLRRLSESYNLDLLDVTTATYQALSNQVGEGAAVFGFMNEAARFAKATVSDLTSAVDTLSGVMNSYGYSAESARKISNELFNVIDLGRVTAGQLGNTIGRVTNIAAKLGVTTGEVGASLALLTRGGISEEEALTQVKNLLNALIDPSEELSKLYADWGVTNGQAAIAAFGFTGVLDRLKVVADSSATELEELTQNIRAFLPALALTGNLKQFNSDLEVIESGAQDVSKALLTIEENFSQVIGKQVKIFKNEMVDSLTSILKYVADFQKERDALQTGNGPFWQEFDVGDIAALATNFSLIAFAVLGFGQALKLAGAGIVGIWKLITSTGTAVETLTGMFGSLSKRMVANNKTFKSTAMDVGDLKPLFLGVGEAGGAAAGGVGKFAGALGILSKFAGALGVLTTVGTVLYGIYSAIDAFIAQADDARQRNAFAIIQEQQIKDIEAAQVAMQKATSEATKLNNAIRQNALAPIVSFTQAINQRIEASRSGVIALMKTMQKSINDETNQIIKDIERQSRAAADATINAYSYEEGKIQRDMDRRERKPVSAKDRAAATKYETLGEAALRDSDIALDEGRNKDAAALIQKAEQLFNKSFSLNNRNIQESKFADLSARKQYVDSLDQTNRLDPQSAILAAEATVRSEQATEAINKYIQVIGSGTPEEVTAAAAKIQELTAGFSSVEALNKTYLDVNNELTTFEKHIANINTLFTQRGIGETRQKEVTDQSQAIDKAIIQQGEAKAAIQNQAIEIGNSLQTTFSSLPRESLLERAITPIAKPEVATAISRARELISGGPARQEYLTGIGNALKEGTPEGIARAQSLYDQLLADVNVLDKAAGGGYSIGDKILGSQDYSEAKKKLTAFKEELSNSVANKDGALGAQLVKLKNARSVISRQERIYEEAGLVPTSQMFGLEALASKDFNVGSPFFKPSVNPKTGQLEVNYPANTFLSGVPTPDQIIAASAAYSGGTNLSEGRFVSPYANLRVPAQTLMAGDPSAAAQQIKNVTVNVGTVKMEVPNSAKGTKAAVEFAEDMSQIANNGLIPQGGFQ